MPKFTKGRSIWPAPVYEGRFADGTVQRMSFYSLAGKPLDFDRGRRGACLRGLQPAASDIVCGHVEIGDDTFADPYFDKTPVVVKPARVSSVDKLLAQLARLSAADRATVQFELLSMG